MRGERNRGYALGDARSQRQERPSAIERLYLALLVHAQHHRLERRIEVQADDVAHLVDKEWIAGELEVLLPVRLLGATRAPAGLPSPERLKELA